MNENNPPSNPTPTPPSPQPPQPPRAYPTSSTPAWQTSAPPLLPQNAPPPPLGTDPAERAPIDGSFAAAEAMLRQPRRILFHLIQPGEARLSLKLLAVAVVCALGYGFVVGTFSGNDQLWAAPLKVAGGLLLCGLICLPSLYIFTCLSGAQTRLGEVAGLVAGVLALMTVLLIGFAPVAWVFSQSTESIVAMGVLHLLFWVVATGFALRFLGNGFDQLRAEVGAGLKVWTIVFLLVMLQMTTALRPMLGTSDSFLPTEKKFFLTHWGEQMRLSEIHR